MIYIISEENDISTNYIIDWLIANRKDYKRLNAESYTPITYKLSTYEEKVTLTGNVINNKDTFFHRRGKLNLIPSSIKQPPVYQFLKQECDSVVKTIELQLKNTISYVGSYLKENQNYKITNLELAKKAGFNIPTTLITSEKNELREFLISEEKIITKTINFPVKLHFEKTLFHDSKTFLVTHNHINILSDFFSPILVQKYIEKVYELRVFVFDNLLYTMAIFSQKNKKTVVDYRNYDTDTPNRCVPFKLPYTIKQQIKTFLSFANINSGSIDIIVTPKNEYIFLEINPQGQFDWVSKNCNYYIEKDIAEYLSH